MPSPAAACIPAATVFAYPQGFQSATHAVAVLAMVIVPALTMVSTIRFRSFKTLDLQARRSFTVLVLVALGLVLVAAEPQYSLVAMAYTYLASGFIGFAWTRLHRRHGEEDVHAPETKPQVSTRPGA
jgi:CDP-diacylglycerol--serine O-phosphatidyltransferase